MGGRIVLLGATGYTGGRTAEAMVACGLRPVLAGRDTARLAALAERLGGLKTARADVTDESTLAGLVGRGDVLVSTVGPFMKLGGPAVAAAIGAGAVYLDSAGEPPFVRQVFEQHGPTAARAGAVLLTAFGSEFVPGVLAGALALREAGEEAIRVDIGYFTTGGGRGQPFSRGTLRSVAGLVLQPFHTWRDGELRTEPAGTRMRTFDVAGRPLAALSMGASEQFALPRFSPGLRTVDVYLGWFGRATPALHVAAPALTGVPALRQVAGRLAGLVAARAAAAPSPQALDGARTHTVAEVFDVTGTLLARTRLVGPDAYTVTAGLLAWAAGRAAARGVRGRGALDPVSAFGLDELLAGAREAGIEVID